MQTRSHLCALVVVLLCAASAADAQVQPEVARRYFDEVLKLCERDAGRLWGVSLCRPMVIVDRATETRATSQPNRTTNHRIFRVLPQRDPVHS